MIIDDSILQKGERINLTLRSLFSECGYEAYRMSKFEEYDLYARNKDFLVSDNVITFTDTGGKLMALKPDVTLSIIKNSKDVPEGCRRVFYSENVYRVSKSTGSFREIMQTGLECFGAVGMKEIAEVIEIAARALKALSRKAVLDISSLALVEKIAEALGIGTEQREGFFKALGEKNVSELRSICKGCEGRTFGLLTDLLVTYGPVKYVSAKLEDLFSGYSEEGYCREFFTLLEELQKSDVSDIINVDLSVVDDINYYNGIVFKGFIGGIPEAVLSGGRYDRLMRKMGRQSSAIGFAVYTDLLEQEDADKEERDQGFLNVALPKGRLGEKVYAMFEGAGYECPGILDPGRKLIFENPDKKIRYFWVKPSDVAVYVERGTADIGVVGKDILLETEADIYELLDLGTGKCKMCVAAPKGYEEYASGTLRVATKFTNITKKYYQSKGRDIDIVHLNGSVEIAPILGLTDVILDIVETGNTLRENDLEIKETVIEDISARLIANKSSFKFKSESIEKLAESLGRQAEERP